MKQGGLKVLEVELLNQANDVIDLYRELYEQRYKTKPLLDPVLPATLLFKRLCRQFGVKHTQDLVRFYIKCNGDKDWYVRKGHSISTLEHEIDAINSAFSLQTHKATPQTNNYNPMVTFETGCPKCNEQHNVTCRASEMGDHAYTKVCKKCIALHLHIVPL